MARYLVLIAASLALVFAEQSDDLETMAKNILNGVHSHLGGESGQNSLLSFVTDSEFAREAALQLNRTRRERIVEGVGSQGITFVSVTRGNKQVNVTTVYGVGAGAVVRARQDTKGEAEEPSFEELNEVTQPLYDTYVKGVEEGEEQDKNAVRVRVGSERRTGFRLRDSRERDEARVAAGFRVGSRTTVSRRG